MNCFLFIFMITLTVATATPVYDLSYEEIVDLVNNCNSLKEENKKLKAENVNLQEENNKLQKVKKKLKQKLKDTKTTLEEATTNNNALKTSNEQCEAELQITKQQLQTSNRNFQSTKNRITRLENKMQMLTSASSAPASTTPVSTTSASSAPASTTPEPTTPEPTTPAPTTPEPTIEDRRIRDCGVISTTNDGMITASSIAGDPKGWGPQHSRLNSVSDTGGWRPWPFEGSWIQLDMGTKKTVRGVATQGNALYYWVTSYSIAFKASTSSSFQNLEDQSGAKKIFQGNTDGNSVVINDVDVEARIIRIYIITWQYYPTFRFDVLLC